MCLESTGQAVTHVFASVQRPRPSIWPRVQNARCVARNPSTVGTTPGSTAGYPAGHRVATRPVPSMLCLPAAHKCTDRRPTPVHRPPEHPPASPAVPCKFWSPSADRPSTASARQRILSPHRATSHHSPLGGCHVPAKQRPPFPATPTLLDMPHPGPSCPPPPLTARPPSAPCR